MSGTASGTTGTFPPDTGITGTGTRQAQITRLYDTVFDRAPDAEGLAFWTAALNRGVALDTVADLFVRSPEFQGRGALGNTDFVGLLYRNGLEREADAPGLDFWTGGLQRTALDRGGAALAISESTEGVASPLTRGTGTTAGTGTTGTDATGTGATAGTGTTGTDATGTGATAGTGTTGTGTTGTDATGTDATGTTGTDATGTLTSDGTGTTGTGADTTGTGTQTADGTTGTATGGGAGTATGGGAGTTTGSGAGTTGTQTAAGTTGTGGAGSGGSGTGTQTADGSTGTGSDTTSAGAQAADGSVETTGTGTGVQAASAGDTGTGLGDDTSFSFVQIRTPDEELLTVRVVGEDLPVGSEVVDTAPAGDAPDAVVFLDGAQEAAVLSAEWFMG